MINKNDKNKKLDYLDLLANNGEAPRMLDQEKKTDKERNLIGGWNDNFDFEIVEMGEYTKDSLDKLGINTSDCVYDKVSGNYFIKTKECENNNTYRLLTIDNDNPGVLPEIHYSSSNENVAEVFEVDNTWFMKFLDKSKNVDIEVSKYIPGSLINIDLPDLTKTIKEGKIKRGSTIYYTTTDRKILENFAGLGELVSNTYENGQGTAIYKNEITEIGNNAFQSCTTLKSIVLPESIITIGDYAFYSCSSLTTINIPDSVTEIGFCTFSNCEKLPADNYLRYADTYLVEAITKTQTSYTIKDGTKWIGSNAFSYCSKMRSVIIPNTVTNICTNAFNSCSYLSSVTIPNSVIKINTNAFYGCTSLESITIPESMTSIESSVFNNCTRLKTVVIPNTITSIGSYAFNKCAALTSITIPDSVTSIGNHTFSECTALNTIICESTQAPTLEDNSVFMSVTTGGKLKIPTGSDYSTWIDTSSYYLGYYGWTIENI